MTRNPMTNLPHSFGSDRYWQERARLHLLQSVEVKQRVVEECLNSILSATKLIVEGFQAGGKLLLCGNGGSAADAQHMAAELVSRLTRNFERPGLPAVALTTDTSFLTGYANDYGFAGVFERQVRALAKSGDVLIGISTSGNSTNVIRAIEAAKEMKLQTIGLLGEGGRLSKLVECAIVVPSQNTLYIQESLLSIEHILCDLTEQALFGEEHCT